MAYDDPELARYKQVNVSVNGYQKTAFEATAQHFGVSPAGLGYHWLMQPEHPLTRESRAHFFRLMDEHEAALQKSFWTRYTQAAV